jgi:hypothetical protein
LETAEHDLEEFEKFRRQWNSRLLEIKRKRDKREWENSREHNHDIELVDKKELKDEAKNNMKKGKDERNQNVADPSDYQDYDYDYAEDELSRSSYLRTTMRSNNFILTLSGSRLSYDTLPDDLSSARGESEQSPGQEKTAQKGDDDVDKKQDGKEGREVGEEEKERRRRKSRWFWLQYEWRKWRWKMKNRTVLRHCMSDLTRNSDKVPERLALLIEEEVSTP